MAFRRNIFTGEVEEYATELENGRAIIARGTPAYPDTPRTGDSFWREGFRCPSLAVNPKQAAAFTRAAHAMGNTDIEYCPKNGDLVCHSDDGKAGEYARRGHYDGTAGSAGTKYLRIFGK